MTNANIFGTWFVVRFMVVVDHPERRNDSYKPVAPGHTVLNKPQFATQREAVRFASELIAGEWDSSAEFVSFVEINQCYPNRSPRTVRKRIERTRASISNAA